jgi:hypothetical protein
MGQRKEKSIVRGGGGEGRRRGSQTIVKEENTECENKYHCREEECEKKERKRASGEMVKETFDK